VRDLIMVATSSAKRTESLSLYSHEFYKIRSHYNPHYHSSHCNAHAPNPFLPHEIEIEYPGFERLMVAEKNCASKVIETFFPSFTLITRNLIRA